MSNSSVIDLSKLPTPKVIEELDYEALFQEYLDDFTARDEEYDGLLESDPAIIILEVMAYREMLVRKRINESAKATLLAFATGSDLDQIVAEYGVERLEGEKDDRLRMRGQMALDGFSTAGPIDAYKFFALSASVKVKSVDVRSDEPGKVIVTILSTEGDGTAVRRESVPENKITVTDGKATLSGKSIDHLVVKDVSGGQTYKENFDYTFDKANSLLAVTVIDEYLIKMHTDLLKSQMTEKAAKIEVLNGQITKAEKEKETIQADLTRIEKLLPSVQERIEKKKILVDKKLLARLTFLEQEEELTNLQEQRNVQAKKMAETEANIESLKKEQRQYLAEFDKNIMQELTESREKLASYQQELIKYQEALKRTIVKAPLSGYVQQLVYHTKGGVVETAKPIMNLVPEDYKLEAEVQILNKDIGFVRPEQDVEIKIDSFPFTKYGTIKGKVRNISGDAIQDEKLGLVFNARLTLLDNKIKADGQIIQLKPGMSVTAEIKTGKRRVIEYLLSPVMKYLNESMRER